MLILWRVNGQERDDRFTREDEACNFIDLLHTHHGAQDIQLLDEDGVSGADGEWRGRKVL